MTNNSNPTDDLETGSGEIVLNVGDKTKRKSVKRSLVDKLAETPESDTNYVDKRELNKIFSKLDQDLETKVAQVCRKENEQLMTSVL